MAAPVQGANQARAPNYKYTSTMRNPPTQAVSVVHNQAAVQAVHVKGNFLKLSVDFNVLIIHPIQVKSHLLQPC